MISVTVSLNSPIWKPVCAHAVSLKMEDSDIEEPVYSLKDAQTDSVVVDNISCEDDLLCLGEDDVDALKGGLSNIVVDSHSDDIGVCIDCKLESEDAVSEISDSTEV